MASHFGYSESYMYRLFFKETGYAPMNYFLHMKIDRACQLLLHTNMKINQVALKLGFDDPYYFSRIFKKIVGTIAQGLPGTRCRSEIFTMNLNGNLGLP